MIKITIHPRSLIEFENNDTYEALTTLTAEDALFLRMSPEMTLKDFVDYLTTAGREGFYGDTVIKIKDK